MSANRRPIGHRSNQNNKRAGTAGNKSGTDRPRGRGQHAHDDGRTALARSSGRQAAAHGRSQERKASTWIADQAAALMPFLLTHISGKSRNNIKSILARGQVSVNGQVAKRHDTALRSGDTVTVNWQHVEEEVPLIGLRIVHEDDDLIVIDKEAGLLSIATDEEREETAYRYLTDYIRTSDPGGRVFIVHRLDRDTSGLMIFAKREEAKRRLQDAWKDVVPERKYYALVEGEVCKDEGTIRSWLKETATLRMYASPVPNGGQEAVTHYRLLERTRSYSLLEVWLDTGRKNQIRVHMESIGHSVAGDKKYGAKTDPIGRLGLHAGSIALYHPSTGEYMRFESPIPSKFKRLFQA